MKSIILVTALTLLLVGCHKLVGGGWFYGLDGEKVHFAFQAKCVEDSDVFGNVYDAYHEGQFQYMDKENGVKFHGDINARVGVGGDNNCDSPPTSLPENFGEVIGECRTQPGGRIGTFTAYFEDNGRIGPNVGDFIRVNTTCTADGSVYENQGYLGGGNISSLGHGKK